MKSPTVEDGMRNVCAAKKEMIYAVGHYICNSLVLRYEFQNIKSYTYVIPNHHAYCLSLFDIRNCNVYFWGPMAKNQTLLILISEKIIFLAAHTFRIPSSTVAHFICTFFPFNFPFIYISI